MLDIMELNKLSFGNEKYETIILKNQSVLKPIQRTNTKTKQNRREKKAWSERAPLWAT